MLKNPFKKKNVLGKDSYPMLLGIDATMDGSLTLLVQSKTVFWCHLRHEGMSMRGGRDEKERGPNNSPRLGTVMYYGTLQTDKLNACPFHQSIDTCRYPNMLPPTIIMLLYVFFKTTTERVTHPFKFHFLSIKLDPVPFAPMNNYINPPPFLHTSGVLLLCFFLKINKLQPPLL